MNSSKVGSKTSVKRQKLLRTIGYNIAQYLNISTSRVIIEIIEATMNVSIESSPITL